MVNMKVVSWFSFKCTFFRPCSVWFSGGFTMIMIWVMNMKTMSCLPFGICLDLMSHFSEQEKNWVKKKERLRSNQITKQDCARQSGCQHINEQLPQDKVGIFTSIFHALIIICIDILVAVESISSFKESPQLSRLI